MLFKHEETELRKADRTVVVNCYIFSNISYGTAWLLQGVFTTDRGKALQFKKPR